jgi:hypothetical protein
LTASYVSGITKVSPFPNCRGGILAIHGFEAAQFVVCRFRLPSELQPWIHDVHVGEVVEVEDDPANWNGHNSERYYCETTGKVPVLYCGRSSCFTCREQYPGGFVQHDSADALITISAEEAAETFPAKVLRFVGIEALRNLARSQYPGAAELLTAQAEVAV